jgi:hypothetical protein
VADPKTVRIIPALSIESGILVSRLRQAKPGDVVTYAEMSKIIGMSVQKHRGSLDTARRIVMRDDRLIFGCVKDVGLKRLDAEEAAASLATDVKGTRAKARKGGRKARAIKYEDVPQDARSTLIARASYLSLVDGTGSPASQRKLVASIETQKKTAFLPLQRALEALREK